MVRQILVDWTTINGSGKVSVFNFSESADVAEQRLALNGFLATVDAIMHSTTSWVIRTSGKELDTASGSLTGVWTDTPNYAGTGAISAGHPLADATQALVQWHTDEIIGGRFVQGRTFLPGIAQGASTDGNLGPTSVTLVANAGQAFADATGGPWIWHRPTNGAGGALSAVQAATCWSELAVLRRRRG